MDGLMIAAFSSQNV